MEFLKLAQLVVTIVIAIMAVLSFLLIGVNTLLNAKIDPLKNEIIEVKSEVNKVQSGQEAILERLDRHYELHLQDKSASSSKN